MGGEACWEDRRTGRQAGIARRSGMEGEPPFIFSASPPCHSAPNVSLICAQTEKGKRTVNRHIFSLVLAAAWDDGVHVGRHGISCSQ